MSEDELQIYEDETLAEHDARMELEDDDEFSRETVDLILDKMLVIIDELSGIPLYPYQQKIARRIVESLIIGDGATITAIQARQCLDADTIVFNQDGSAGRLRDMKGAALTGVKPTKRYRLRGGAELVMTDEHMVFSERGLVPAGTLKPGDKVSMMSYSHEWLGENTIDRDILVGKHKTPVRIVQAVNADLAKWLGYFTTDGSRRPGQSAKFTNMRDAYLREFHGLTESTFEVTPKWYAKGNAFDLLMTSSKSSYDNRVLDVLHALDWDHGFPKDVFRWDPETVSDFVNRAWAGDGCITMKSEGPEVFLACGNDETYAAYWQALLLKFGVTSQIKREQMPKGTGTFHRLVLGCGESNLRRFFQSFGLIYGKEEQSLAAIDFFALRQRGGGKGYPLKPKRLYEPNGMGPDGEELVWSKVVSIEDAGEREVWDPHVPGKGWVIAQGFQVSNSGKSEVVANTISACMVMLPILAKIFPDLLDKFKRGFWVGCFAPTDDQAEIVYSRIVARLTSDRAQEFFADPDIAQKVTKGHGNTMHLSNGSLIRRQTAHPRSNIEGRTYHLMLVDECQDADARVINKSIGPMGASTNATMVFIGTPSYTKGAFYNTIQNNKRQQTKRGARTNHFEVDWKEVSKYNKNYEKFVKKEMLRIGEDSDEFRLAYRLHWLLDKGMFTTSERLEELGDKSMELVPAWHKTPVVVGIDPARKQDSTIVTVVWVDWDHPDEYGVMEHRVLNWMDLSGLDWEAQYARIVDFLSNYRVFAIAVDEGGLGDPVIQRLRILMPHTEIVGIASDRSTQSKRWKHLKSLLERGKIGWPAHAKTRRLKIWKRFSQQMEDLELHFEGPYVVAAAPKAADAHDDYADSLALACIVAKDYQIPEVEVSQNFFFN